MSITQISNPSEEPRDGKKRAKPQGDKAFETQWSPTNDLPDASLFALNFTQRALEVLYGSRDLAQIARWVTDDVYKAMQAKVDARTRKLSLMSPDVRERIAHHFTLSHVTIGNPREGIIEACVVVRGTQRIRAAALRLEGYDHRWRATSFTIL
jgi:hypothetical protein